MRDVQDTDYVKAAERPHPDRSMMSGPERAWARHALVADQVMAELAEAIIDDSGGACDGGGCGHLSCRAIERYMNVTGLDPHEAPDVA